MRVIKRIPNFIGHEPSDLTESEFTTIEELHNIYWIKKWSDAPGFHRFSVRGKKDLMCEYDGGKRSYWMGRLENNDVGLPEWVKPEGK